MKLAAIYNVWDSEELLKYSINSVRSRVDIFIIVYQTVSNYGENHDPFPEIEKATRGLNTVLHHYVPDLTRSGTWNETEKRNIGLKIAKQKHCSHFLFMDCDEVYQDFDGAVRQYIAADTPGSVCPIYTYFKLPTLRFENPDTYYVPFIHALGGSTTAGNYEYPYYVDPTRKVKCREVTLLQEPMHHFSYVRRDIVRKCRNSSAKVNIERSTILEDYALARHGHYVKDFFGQRLKEVPNQFGIEV